MRRFPALLLLLAPLATAQTAPVRLSGAPNFRDIGGLPTADGRTIKAGVVYRSGQLSGLTAEDYAALAPLGIRVVYDLRTDGERAGAPTRWSGSPAPDLVSAPMAFGTLPVNLPLPELLKQLAERIHSEQDARALMETGMTELVETGRGQLGKVLAGIAAGTGAAVVHCTAGKDRTGLLMAVLLSILEVPHDRIVQDYLQSNVRLASGGALPENLKSPIDPQFLRPLTSVDAAYLEGAFEKIRRDYGSITEYRRRGLGLSDEQARQLRSRLLE